MHPIELEIELHTLDALKLLFSCRFLLRSWVKESVTKRFPKWPAIDAAISKEGWKLITLLRLSPIIPWNLLNYAVSVTGEALSFEDQG